MNIEERHDDHPGRPHGGHPPHHPAHRVRIDGQWVEIESSDPSGEALLAAVGKRPCAFELIEEFPGHRNVVIEPAETVDLTRPGVERFITAHKEIVTIFINGDPYTIERGERSVADILAKIGQTPDGYVLLEEKDGPPMPVPTNQTVTIHGCEVFHAQVQSGGSS